MCDSVEIINAKKYLRKWNIAIYVTEESACIFLSCRGIKKISMCIDNAIRQLSSQGYSQRDAAFPYHRIATFIRYRARRESLGTTSSFFTALPEIDDLHWLIDLLAPWLPRIHHRGFLNVQSTSSVFQLASRRRYRPRAQRLFLLKPHFSRCFSFSVFLPFIPSPLYLVVVES